MPAKTAKHTEISTQLPLAVKSGKISVGFKSAVKLLIKNKVQGVIVASNIPEDMRRLLEYYCVLANNTPMRFYESENTKLAGLIKPDREEKEFNIKNVSVVTVLDQGEADLFGNIE